jgi:hypothetical protein
VASPAPVAAQEEEDAAVLNPAEPDVVVVNLPTAMRQPVLKGSFRLTHRFAGNLRRGSFGQQASNLFGLDQGAIIGFEYRIGVVRHVQAAFYRSSFDKTIQLHGKYDAIRQQHSMPVSMSPLVSIEGTNNCQEEYAPAIGVVISRVVGTRAGAYITPMWVGNTAASLTSIDHGHDDDGNPDWQPSRTRPETRRTSAWAADCGWAVPRTWRRKSCCAREDTPPTSRHMASASNGASAGTRFH